MKEITKEELYKLAPPTGNPEDISDFDLLSFFQHKALLGVIVRDKVCGHFAYTILVQDHPGHYRAFEFEGGFDTKESAVKGLQEMFEMNEEVEVIPLTFEEIHQAFLDRANQRRN